MYQGHIAYYSPGKKAIVKHNPLYYRLNAFLDDSFCCLIFGTVLEQQFRKQKEAIAILNAF